MTYRVFATLILSIVATGVCHGQVLIDPGFESYAVNAGGYVIPTDGPWTYTNNAGVVEPFSPNSSTDPLFTWSATFAAPEGAQYASTYAGGDSITQAVQFDRPGDYVVSVMAAAPDGDVSIPPIGVVNLVDAEFRFTINNARIGDLHTLTPGTDWTLFSAGLTIDTPGTVSLGIHNPKTAPYFINFDNFSIVPEPGSFILCTLGTLALLASRRRL